MSDPIRDFAALVVEARRGGPVEALTGFVGADDGDGTVTVNLGGDDIPGVPRLASYTAPAFGDLVLVLLVGGSPWVLGKSAAV